MATSSVLGAVLLAVWWGGGLGVSAQSQDPDYSNVDDILNGERTLVTIQDLVLSVTSEFEMPIGKLGVHHAGILTTSNSQLNYDDTDIPVVVGVDASYVGRSFAGRMFNTPTPTIVMVVQHPTTGGALIATLFSPQQVIGPPVAAIVLTGGMADFNQDGYDDLVLTSELGDTYIVTAADVHANIIPGELPPFKFGPVSRLDPVSQLAIGDFNGDGQPEVAGLLPLSSGGLALVIYTIDPKTLTVARAEQITLNTPGTSASEPVTHMSIASGRFTASAHDQYAYFVTPYIFGQVKLPGTPDNPSQPAPDAYGFIRTAFVVDPTRNDAGGWWRQAYSSAPDVALNHPTRWVITNPPTTQPIPSNCRPVGGTNSQMNCATLAESHPTNPWVSPFHHMRGLFITTASDQSSESGPSGPQLGSAEAGDQLHLWARVYNYSLTPMPAGTIVHARFYVQPWNSRTQTPVGESVLIGEDRLSPIPPFSTDDGAPLNWVLAKTTFDTTPYANKDLTFWVVVWMDDGNGKMVPEIESHGLRSIPGTLTSLADIQPETYSNNVGFYKYVFHVFPPASSAAALTASLDDQPPEVGAEPVPVDIGKVRVSAHRVAPGQTVEVSALLSGANGRESHGTAVFYDGNPHAGGKAFDAERVSHIAAGSSHLVKTLYRPDTCGVHKLYVVVGKGTSTEVSRRSWPVWVPCRPFGVSKR
jgi:hypothetical protein